MCPIRTLVVCTALAATACGGTVGHSGAPADGGADANAPGPDSSPPSASDAGCTPDGASAPDTRAFLFARWPMPNSSSDVSRGAPHPQAYHDNTDGTVTDTVTGLVWQQGWSSQAYSWYDAPTYCAGLTLAGRTWRVPTSIELFSLADVSLASAGIDPVDFPNTPSTEFWSSTPSLMGGDGAWYVFFGSNPYVADINAPDPQDVRCVASACPPAGGDHYTVANGTVTDNWTHLTWEQATPPGTFTVAQAASHCAALSLAGATWRLPTVKELLTLVDVTQDAPMIDPTAFPGTPPVAFWTGTIPLGRTDGWLVSFQYGYSSSIAVDDTPSVRCVQ